MAWNTTPGNGRGEQRDRDEWMRESTGGGRREWDRDEMERRTRADEIDRRHDWHEGGYGESGRAYGEGSRGYGEGSPGAYPGYAGRGHEMPGGEMRGSSTYGESGGYAQGSSFGSGGEYGIQGAGMHREGWSRGHGTGHERDRDFRERGTGAGFGREGGRWARGEGTYAPAGYREREGFERGGRGMGRGMRPGAYGLHTAMAYGEESRGERARGWEREGALVRDVMTRDPRTLHRDATCADAARVMRDDETGIVPIVHEGRVAGVITDRDIVCRVIAENRSPHETRVSEVMSEDVHVCSPDGRLTEAVKTMAEENVRRLPVVDRDGRLRGMLSMTDVAREAELDYALQEALEQIARRRSFWSRW